MSHQDTFDRTLASLYKATLDNSHWPAASALIDEACQAKGNRLAVGEGLRKDAKVYFANFYFRGQRRQDLEREYFDHYHPRDECLPRLRLLPDSRLVHVGELYTNEELKTSPVYNEGLPHLGSQNGLIAHLDGPDSLRIVWAVADPIKGRDWKSDQIEMIERLLPHIRHFVCVRLAVASADALGSSLSGLLGTTRVGVIHLDRRGRIVETNGRANDILRRNDGLFDQDGFLGAWLSEDNADLQRLLERALPTFGGQGVGGSLTLQRRSGLPRLAVHISPVSIHQTDFGFLRVVALVLVGDPGSRPRINAGLVSQTLGLTRAESEVAVLLAEGRGIRDIALAKGCQESTVRWFLKRMYRKLGISRQADLVRLVLSLLELPESPR